MKAMITGVEPFAFKGGKLCAIHKGRGDVDEAESYRGILLSNTFAKITHAWARRRLLPTLIGRKTIGQLGGLPSQQTGMGIQAFRIHSQVGALRHLSTATVFIDLKAAFHHMLREFIFSTSNQLARNTLATMLDETDFDIEQIMTDLDAIRASPCNDIPAGLRKFLHDLHHFTWFVLNPAERPEDELHTRTMRGTRPGSPMADIGFNLLMSGILHEVQQELLQSEEYTEGSTALGIFVPPVGWVDDVAIPLTTTEAPKLVPLVQLALATMHTAFRRRGLTMNLSKGKTEVIINFRGPQAVQCRTQLFDRDRQPVITVSTATHVFSVRVVTSYKHLGAKFAMSLDIEAEITARLVQPDKLFSK